MVDYKKLIDEKLQILSPVFARAAVGDFSIDIVIPEKEDEFTQLFVGVQVMLEVIREQISELRTSDQKKTEFLSMAAHQLRTPLGSVRWTVELLNKRYAGILPAPVEEKLTQIHETNQRMLHLINELLDISRIEQKRLPDKPELVDVGKIIEEVLAELKHEIETQLLSVTVDVEQNTPQIFVDKEHFRQVLQNLISNAVRYNKKNGTLEVKVMSTDSYVKILVRDTGIGIPKEEQPKIFDTFFRASNATLMDRNGSGLGLCIVKNYVEHWQGTVSFESEEDKGSAFTITLPRKSG